MGPCICKPCVVEKGRRLSPPQPSITVSAKPGIVRVTLVVDGGVHTKELSILQVDRLVRLLEAANRAAINDEWQVLGSVDY